MYCIEIYIILYIFNSFTDFVPFPPKPILPNGACTGVPFPYSAYRAGTRFRYPRSCFPRLVEFLFYIDTAAVEHIPQLHSCHSGLLGYLVKRVLSEHRDRRVALLFRKLLTHSISPPSTAARREKSDLSRRVRVSALCPLRCPLPNRDCIRGFRRILQ